MHVSMNIEWISGVYRHNQPQKFEIVGTMIDLGTSRHYCTLLYGNFNGGRETFRVYSDRTRQRQNDGVKHKVLDLEYMLVNRGIQTGRVASKNLYNRDAVDLTLSDCVNEQYSGLRAIYVCNRHLWLRAVASTTPGVVVAPSCGYPLNTGPGQPGIERPQLIFNTFII